MGGRQRGKAGTDRGSKKEKSAQKEDKKSVQEVAINDSQELHFLVSLHISFLIKCSLCDTATSHKTKSSSGSLGIKRKMSFFSSFFFTFQMILKNF